MALQILRNLMPGQHSLIKNRIKLSMNSVGYNAIVEHAGFFS